MAAPAPETIPETAGIPAEWWIVFFTVVGISSVITYGFQEKANRWHEKGLVGPRMTMWMEIAAIPVCCALGWYSIHQADLPYIRPWGGLLAGFLGSMASPWFLSIIGRLINRRLGKNEEEPKPEEEKTDS
jgi:hypothetical protein